MNLFAPIFGFLWWLFRKLHQKKLLLPLKVDPKVWVVGAHQVGGAGRTLLTAAIADELTKQNLKVEVLCHSLDRTSKRLDDKDRFPYLNEDALYIFKKTGLPTHTCPLRGQWLQENSIEHLDVLLCDGGLEDPNLKGAFQIRLNPPAKIGFSDLLPFGRFRSRLQDHRSADLVLREGIDYKLVYKIPEIPKGAEIVTAGGNPQAWIQNLEDLGLRFAKHHKRKDHDPNFYPFIFYTTQHNPTKNFVIGPKEAAKIPSGFKRKNLYSIDVEVVWLRDDLPWLVAK